MGVDLSITNVTIIFIYIVLVLCYFLYGYIFNLNETRLINLVHRKKGTLGIKNRQDYNEKEYFDMDYLPYVEVLNFNSNNDLGLIVYLITFIDLAEDARCEKLDWLYIYDLLPTHFIEIRLVYTRECNKFFYNVCKKNSFFLDSNYSFFNGIELYMKNFLYNLYDRALTIEYFEVKEPFSALNFLYHLSTKKSFAKSFISNFNIYIFDNIYTVILGMVKENISGNLKESIKFFPFIFSLFIFVLASNLIGLIPYSSTVTSYLIITFALAIMVLVGVNIIAGRLHGLVYFGHFLPAGCPFALYPLIIPIEFISYIFRVVSLSVRLFANMMAGHTLLAVLAGFGWTMVNTNINLVFYHPLPILVVFILVFLETAVAIIQAYVFAILSCMYLDEAINLH